MNKLNMSAFFWLFLSLPFVVSAQTTIVPVSDLSLTEVEIVEQTDTEITVRTTIRIGSSAENDLSYVLNLYGEGELIDSYTHPTTISVESETFHNQALTYIPPGHLDGQYQLVVAIQGGNGIPLAFAPVTNAWNLQPYSAGESNEMNDSSRLVSILPETCILTKQINSGITEEYTLRDTIPLGEEEQLDISCSLVNNSAEDITVYPRMAVYTSNSLGEIVIPGTINQQYEITLGPNLTTEVVFPVMASRGQDSFVTVLEFVDTDNTKVSNDINIRYASYGLQADILSLSLDKNYYLAGSAVDVSFAIALRNNLPNDLINSEELVEPQATFTLTNGLDQTQCAEEFTTEVRGGAQSVSFRSDTDCVDPILSMSVFDDAGEVAFSEIQLTSTDVVLTTNRSTVLLLQIMFGLGLLLIIGSIAWMLMRNKKQNTDNDVNSVNVKPLTLLLMTFGFAAFSFLGSVNYVSAASAIVNQYYVTYDVNSFEGDRYPKVTVEDLLDALAVVNYESFVTVFDQDGDQVTRVILDPFYGNILSTELPELFPGTYTFEFTIENIAASPVVLDFQYVVADNSAGNNGNNGNSGDNGNGNNLPDLTSTNLVVPAEVMAGQPFDISASLNNNSPHDADNDFINTISYQFVSETVVVSETQREFLSGWKTTNDTFEDLTLTATGTYTFSHCVDTGQVINEREEENNCTERTLTVIDPAPPVVSISASRDFIRPSETTTLSWSTSHTNDCVLSSKAALSWLPNLNIIYDDVPVPVQEPGMQSEPLPRTQTFTVTCTSPIPDVSPARASVLVEVNEIANPPIANPCNGIDLSIVVDTSGSISAVELRQVNDGLIEMIESINTNTVYSFSTFSTNAQVRRSFSMNKEQAINYLQSISGGGSGWTNWERGLVVANSTFDPRPDKQNVILFASDGKPTHYGSPALTSSEDTAVSFAIAAGNQIKDQGTAIYIIGIGGGLAGETNIANLEAISGPGAVVSSSFENVGEVLNQISAGQMCGGIDQCINPVPNAQLLGVGETIDITDPVSWSYSPVNTENKCEFVCSPGYFWEPSGQSCVREANGDLFINGSNNPQEVESREQVELTWSSDDVIDESTCEVVSLQDDETILSSGLGDNTDGVITNRLFGGIDGAEYSYLFECDGIIIDVESVDVAPGNPVDLVSSISANLSPGFSLETGYYDYFSLNYIVTNFGEISAGPFSNYLTVDIGQDGSEDVSTTDNTHTDTGLAGNGSETDQASVQMTVTGGVSPGDHRLCVTADFNGSTDSIDEDNEDNNRTCTSVNSTYPDPQISIRTEPSALVTAGESIDLIWDINGAGYIQECVLQGLGIKQGGEVVYTGNTGERLGGLYNIGPINSQAEYLFTCTAVDLVTEFTSSVVIETTGTVREI